MKTISEIVPEGTLENPIMTKKEIIFDKLLYIYKISFMDGDKGEYAKIIFTLGDSETYYQLLTGSSFILPKLHIIKDINDFPISATIRSLGNANYME